MKNDIYGSRESKGVHSNDPLTQQRDAPPVQNVWVRSLRRQRIINAILLLLVVAVAALLVVIGFQQSRQIELQRELQVDESVRRPAPAVESDADLVHVRPLASLPGEDERTGLMLDQLRAQDRFEPGILNRPFHKQWVQQATWHLLQAEEARRNEDWPRALEEFERVSQMFPDMGGVHGAKGLIHMQGGNYEEALSAFENAMDVEGVDVSLLNNRAVALMRLNRVDSAIETLERAAQMNPAYTAALYNLAVAHARAENTPQALESYRSYLRRAPNDLDGTLSFAALFIDSQDWQGAQELLTIADRMSPATPPILFRLAQAQAQTGQLRDALDTLNRALMRADARQALQWIGRREFDPLRDEAEFQRLLETLGE